MTVIMSLHIIVFCEGLYFQQIAFPHVNHVFHIIWIAGEMFHHSSVKRVGILRLQPGSDVRHVFLCYRFSKLFLGREGRRSGRIIILFASGHLSFFQARRNVERHPSLRVSQKREAMISGNFFPPVTLMTLPG